MSYLLAIKEFKRKVIKFQGYICIPFLGSIHVIMQHNFKLIVCSFCINIFYHVLPSINRMRDCKKSEKRWIIKYHPKHSFTNEHQWKLEKKNWVAGDIFYISEVMGSKANFGCPVLQSNRLLLLCVVSSSVYRTRQID